MRLIKILTPILVLMTFSGHAPAITYGEPDVEEHPNVGALLRSTGFTTFVAYCSGVLIAPDVLLTAAHCRRGPDDDSAQVTFDSEITPGVPTNVVDGTFIVHPAYPDSDIAIVLLADSQDPPFAQLPTAGQFDDLKQMSRDQQFTAVGYGLEEPIPGPGGIMYNAPNARQVSTPSLNAVNKTWLRLSQNPATGDGGTCFGDSGGPNFLGADAGPGDVVAGITITGDAICRATNVVRRLDTPMALEFLQQYLNPQ